MNNTSEFSFVLKPSNHGVGVFAAHNIVQGTHLRLFGDGETLEIRSLLRPKESVPESFRQYCMDRSDGLICPEDFSRMHIGWYLNHSPVPNAYRDEAYEWHALRDIVAGEEVLIDYNFLEEPDEAKDTYYHL